MARPSKLNEQLIQQMVNLFEEGVPIVYVCDNVGILPRSYFQWMEIGERDFSEENETIYSEFFHSIKKAQSDYVINTNRDIRSGRMGWQGAAWWLERTKQEFMPKQEITAGDDGKVTVVLGGKVKEVKQNDLSK